MAASAPTPTRHRGQTLRALHKSVIGVLWVWLLVSVPVTSFPPVSEVAGGTIVSPMSLIPLAGLVLLWFVPALLSGKRLPRLAIPLLVFALAASVSALLAPFYGFFPFHGQGLLGQSLQGIGTLTIGLAYYFVVSTYARNEDDLRACLRWLYAGLLLLLVWSTPQVFWIISGRAEIPRLWQDLQHLLSVRDAFATRATGLAYEPSWLADQMLMLYLPLLLASVLRRESVLPIRLKGISIEWFLLGWSLAVLYFTFSRIGFAAFLALVAVIVIWLSARAVVRLSRKTKGRGRPPLRGSLGKAAGIFILGLVAFAIVVTVVLALGSAYDPRLGLVLRVNYQELVQQHRHPVGYLLAARLAYAERVMYWAGGVGAFDRFPLLGVGLGNAGFLFPETVPYFGSYLPEILRAVHHGAQGLPNVKSLWIRTLAETGIVGFLLFVSWLGFVGAAGCKLARNRRGVQGVVSLAALFALISLVFEGFSLDTFALPQLWIAFGLVTCCLGFPPPDPNAGSDGVRPAASLARSGGAAPEG